MNEQNKITRGEFLRLSGASALFLGGLTLNTSPVGAAERGESLEGFEEGDPPILRALRSGITAPNPHNTQAWKFKIINDKEALLYVDENRTLPETDPTTRQIHIGQGAFLEHCRLGANAIGYRAEFKILPEGEYKVSNIGKYPTAHIALKKSTQREADSYLYQAIPERATNRTSYHGEWMGENLFNNIVASVNPRYADFHYVPENAARADHFPLLKSGFVIEMKTRAKSEESRKWFRLSDKEIRAKRDGITLQGNGISGLKLFLARNFFFSLEPEVYHSQESITYAIENFSKALDSSAGLVYMRTEDNRMRNWIECGVDYARFQLELTSRSLVMQPMSQALQEYVENEGVFHAYRRLTQTKGSQKVQMVMRIGKSNYFFKSPRRDLNSMVIDNSHVHQEGGVK